MSDTSSQTYPTSLPFTRSVASPESHAWRRWALLLGGGTLLVLSGMALGLFLLARLDRRMETARSTLDGMTTAHLYQCYVNLGLLADSAENGIYIEQDRDDLLKTTLGLLDSADAQLNRLVGAGLIPSDDSALERFRRLSKLLREQAAELRAYWETDSKDHAHRFQRARDEAWAVIRELVDAQP
jgi:hypothetical protein